MSAVAKLDRNQGASSELRATNLAAVALSLTGMCPESLRSTRPALAGEPEESSWQDAASTAICMAAVATLVPAMLALALHVLLYF